MVIWFIVFHVLHLESIAFTHCEIENSSLLTCINLLPITAIRLFLMCLMAATATKQKYLSKNNTAIFFSFVSLSSWHRTGGTDNYIASDEQRYGGTRQFIESTESVHQLHDNIFAANYCNRFDTFAAMGWTVSNKKWKEQTWKYHSTS